MASGPLAFYIGFTIVIASMMSLLAVFVVGLVRDQRVRLAMKEAQLKQIREKQETIRQQAALLDKASDAIIVIDLQHRIQFWNGSAEKLFGWSAEEALNSDVRQRFYRSVPLHLYELSMDVAKTRGEWSGEIELRSKNGEVISIFSRWTLVRDDAGNAKSILIVDSDITENKRLEAQFLRAQRMEILGVLAGGIAHDLNNILNPIVVSIEGLRKKVVDESSRRIVSTIESSARRGVTIVRQMLAFARGTGGKRDFLKPSYLIREMFSIASESFPRSIRTELNFAPDLWPVFGDATQLHQVLLNLCINARDSMPEGGKLQISAENLTLARDQRSGDQKPELGRYVVLRVKDTGTGIASDQLDRIFEPFYTTKEMGKGTGLGLSTAAGIVKNHNGHIEVTSELGKGSTFSVFLPAVEYDGHAPGETGSTASRSAKGELILLVDDEASVREIMSDVLRSHGYSVVTAVDGAEALLIFQQRKGEIKAVVTDMMMPAMNGVTLMQRLRKMNPELPIIATSGYWASALPEEWEQTVADRFLMKPSSSNELVNTVRKVLEEREERTPTPGEGGVP